MTAAASATATASASSGDAAVADPVAVATGSLDFGSCTNPTIEFGLGFDGRKDNSFEPVNKTDFNHGSALNIKVIADFICQVNQTLVVAHRLRKLTLLQQLNDKCKAAAATITACNQGETAAIALGAVGGAADAFNAALGFQVQYSYRHPQIAN